MNEDQSIDGARCAVGLAPDGVGWVGQRQDLCKALGVLGEGCRGRVGCREKSHTGRSKLED